MINSIRVHTIIQYVFGHICLQNIADSILIVVAICNYQSREWSKGTLHSISQVNLSRMREKIRAYHISHNVIKSVPYIKTKNIYFSMYLLKNVF